MSSQVVVSPKEERNKEERIKIPRILSPSGPDTNISLISQNSRGPPKKGQKSVPRENCQSLSSHFPKFVGHCLP